MNRLVGLLAVALVLSVLPILPDNADAMAPAFCGGKVVTIDMNSGASGIGTAGNDVILGTPQADVIDGKSGSDTICGGDGQDDIRGGSGVDHIFGQNGNDVLDGEGGSDRIHGGPGNDLIKGDSGADRLWGGPGDDEMYGMGGQDFMWGEAGNDVMQGNFQSDNMFGGPGDDTMYGAGGKDTLFGEGGNDSLNGGDNTDYLHGGGGVDSANGGRGRDNPLVTPKVRAGNGQFYDGSGCVAETIVNCQNTSPIPTPTPTSVAPTPTPTRPNPTPTPTAVAPTPTPTPPAGGRFVTLPVGAALPSGAQCAALVRPAVEIRPENAVANANRGSRANANNRGGWAPFDRIDGDFAGTTDEIIQWAACKWGIDEDIVRAQVIKESYWYQSANGDNGESWGLGQVRDTAHQSAFEFAVNARSSSAYNLDYTYGNWRACFEGTLTWLNNVEHNGTYGPGDAWGCLGVWFSGRWYVNNDDYLNRPGDSVRFHFENRTWLTQAFINN